MSFLHPPVLFGLLAVSVPVAIHLLHRFRVRRMEWAAMRFLLTSVQRTQKRRNLEDLLLLLLRCLLVAALVLAFAQPILRALVAGRGTAGPATVVVLLDNSASMGQSDGVQTRFEQAKKEIGAWLDTLPADSRVALYAVSNVADPLVGKPAPDLALVRRALQLAAPTDRGSDLAVGVRAGLQVLKATPTGTREIRIYTDSQSSAWTHLDEIKKMGAASPDVGLTPVILGQRGEDNVGLTALTPEGGIVAVNQPIRFRAQVGNVGAAAVENVRVTLAADGGAASDQKLIPRIEPGASVPADLFVRFTTPGAHSVTATLPADRFPADNQRSAAVRAVERLGVLILETHARVPRPERDGYFLANALVPLPHERAAGDYLKVFSAPLAGFDPGALANYEFVFLCDPGAVPPDLAAALPVYVENGGNVILFPGPDSVPAQWRQTPAFLDLLPVVLGERKDLTVAGKFLAWQSSGFQHPVTALWSDPAQGNLGSIRTTTYFPLTLKPADARRPPPAVVVAYADGQAAVVAGACGRGHVVVFSSTATPQWTNLPLHPAFVPFMQRLLGYLNRQNSPPLVFAPGEAVVVPVSINDLGADFSVVRPGKDSAKHAAGKVELAGDRPVICYTDTAAAGVYQIFLRDAGSPAFVFAVQIDPAESDLRQADAREVAALSDPRATAAGTDGATETHPVVTREFWTPLVWLAAFFAATEFALSHWFSRSR